MHVLGLFIVSDDAFLGLLKIAINSRSELFKIKPLNIFHVKIEGIPGLVHIIVDVLLSPV